MSQSRKVVESQSQLLKLIERRQSLVNFLIICFFVCVAGAQSPQAIVSTTILPDGDIAFKQRCELVVCFLTDGFAFAEPPVFPDIKIKGAIVIPPNSGMNFSERRQGETWIGIERHYQVYPAQMGALAVPAVTLHVRVRNSAGISDMTASSAAFVRAVIVPPDMAEIPQAIVTPELSVSQQWEPDANELKVGEALQRTVTITADSTTAMLLPPLPAADMNGLSIYPGQPTLNDRDVRGSVTAMRTDSITYVCEREGEYLLPEISLQWWHPQTRELHEEVLPGLMFRVEENPELAAAQAAMESDDPGSGPGRRSGWPVLILLVGAAVIWGTYRRYGSLLQQHWVAWQQARSESESAYFHRFQQACSKNDPQRALQTLRYWLDHSLGTDWTLDAFCESVSTTGLRPAVDELNDQLFGFDVPIDPSWSGRKLMDTVSQARMALRKRRKDTKSKMILCEMYPKDSGFGIQGSVKPKALRFLNPEP
ncbi:BatD family protein [Planctomycetota bacterium]